MLPLQGGASLIPGGGTKIPHAEWCSQNKERRKERLSGSPECKTDEAETGLWLGHGHICQEPLPSYPSQHPFSPPAPLLLPGLCRTVWSLIFLITEFILKQFTLSHLKQTPARVFCVCSQTYLAAHSQPLSPGTMATLMRLRGWQGAQQPGLR